MVHGRPLVEGMKEPGDLVLAALAPLIGDVERAKPHRAGRAVELFRELGGQL